MSAWWNQENSIRQWYSHLRQKKLNVIAWSVVNPLNLAHSEMVVYHIYINVIFIEINLHKRIWRNSWNLDWTHAGLFSLKLFSKTQWFFHLSPVTYIGLMSSVTSHSPVTTHFWNLWCLRLRLWRHIVVGYNTSGTRQTDRLIDRHTYIQIESPQ